MRILFQREYKCILELYKTTFSCDICDYPILTYYALNVDCFTPNPLLKCQKVNAVFKIYRETISYEFNGFFLFEPETLFPDSLTITSIASLALLYFYIYE